MSDNTTAANKDSAPNEKPKISPEVQKVIDKSQLVQAQIQEAQIENVKVVYDLIAKIDKKRKDEIEKQFEDGVIQLEEVDENDEVKIWTTKYRPMTTRAEEAVNEMLRTIKVFKKDIKNKMPLEDLQRKYPELTVGVESLEELEPEMVKTLQKDKDGVVLLDKDGKPIYTEEEKDSDTFNSIVNTYTIKKRAKIYFKIDDISNYSKKDLSELIYLYQSRNNYNPYYINPT